MPPPGGVKSCEEQTWTTPISDQTQSECAKVCTRLRIQRHEALTVGDQRGSAPGAYLDNTGVLPVIGTVIHLSQCQLCQLTMRTVSEERRTGAYLCFKHMADEWTITIGLWHAGTKGHQQHIRGVGKCQLRICVLEPCSAGLFSAGTFRAESLHARKRALVKVPHCRIMSQWSCQFPVGVDGTGWSFDGQTGTPLHLHLRTSVQSTASCLLQLEPWRAFLLLAASSAGDSSRNPQMTFPSFQTNHQYLPPSSSSNLANMRPTSSSLTNFRYPCSTSASSDFLAHLAAFLRSLMT